MKLGKAIFFGSIVLIIFCASIAYYSWFQLRNNYVNISCTNFIFHSQHLDLCANWNRKNGILTGIIVPIVVITILAEIGIWFTYFSKKFE